MTHEAGIEAAQDKIWAISHGEYGIDAYGAEKVIKAYLSASGMVLVPREPTKFMSSNLYAYGVPHGEIEDAYKILVDRAPNPFESKP